MNQLINQEDPAGKIDDKAVNGLTGVHDSLAYKVAEIEKHLHHSERWYGKLGSQTATNWFELESLTAFQCISGSGDFGSDANDEAQLVGSGDTSSSDGVYFDLHRVVISDASATTPYVLRIVWGTGTLSADVSAGQFTDFMIRVPASTRATPLEVNMPRVEVGTKVWSQCKNATDNATVDLFVGLHFYEG